MDAFTFAAGGSRLEVGNGSNMLHTEYYPDDQVQMSIDLRDKVITYYDFMVAYENILRDGQQVIKRDVSSTNYSLSETAQGDSISFINKEDEQYEILHLINLLGTDNLWRDAAGTKLKPEIANNISINYETENEIKEVYLVSPDLNNGVPTLIDFKKDNNTYKLVVPSLEYWDTLLFVKE
jgi:dextranase